MTLEEWGWAEPFQSALIALGDPDLEAARVCSAHRGGYVLMGRHGQRVGHLGGRLRHGVRDDGELPAVGDWVAARVPAEQADGVAVIAEVLPRRTALIRQRPERFAAPQVIAANLDTVFIVCALNQDFNLRRLERYLAAVWSSGARPVVLLNKADLCPDVTGFRERAMEVALGTTVHALSALGGGGLDALAQELTPRATVALVGSSGVGKSTLANALLGQQQLATADIREADGRGRHTTTQRQLVRLPGGALLIDTPGMRELGLWDAEEGVGAAFDDVEALARECRFGDCSHGAEPGCALRRALGSGALDEARYRSYLKLQREIAYLERRLDERAQRDHDLAMRKVWAARRRHTRAHPKR